MIILQSASAESVPNQNKLTIYCFRKAHQLKPFRIKTNLQLTVFLQSASADSRSESKQTDEYQALAGKNPEGNGLLPQILTLTNL